MNQDSIKSKIYSNSRIRFKVVHIHLDWTKTLHSTIQANNTICRFRKAWKHSSGSTTRMWVIIELLRRYGACLIRSSPFLLGLVNTITHKRRRLKFARTVFALTVTPLRDTAELDSTRASSARFVDFICNYIVKMARWKAVLRAWQLKGHPSDDPELMNKIVGKWKTEYAFFVYFHVSILLVFILCKGFSLIGRVGGRRCREI